MYHVNWKDHYMALAELISQRSDCLRRNVGAVIIKNERVISTGFNHVPKFCKACKQFGCLRNDIPSGERHEVCRAIHAEQEAIILAKQDLTGTTMFVTTQPCTICAKMIVYSGISNLIYKGEYNDKLAIQMLSDGGVNIYQHDPKEN